LRLGSLQHVNQDYFHGRSGFWNDQLQHRTYDEYWRARNLAPYVRKIRIPVLSTGGWWDAEDRYGSLEIAKILQAGAGRPGSNNPSKSVNPVNFSTLVVGPTAVGAIPAEPAGALWETSILARTPPPIGAPKSSGRGWLTGC
jgi:hypothetical protein